MTAENTIFKLIEIKYCDENPQYPEFEVYSETIGYFSSLGKAVDKMNRHLRGKSGARNRFGFFIKEYALDGEWILPTESRRSYLPDGSPCDENLLSETPKDDYTSETFPNSDPFLGRPADKVRFQRGDIVEVLWYDATVSLEIITHVPLSPEEVNAKREKYGTRLALFSEDDCYSTLSHENRSSCPEAVYLFPPRFTVSRELRKNLEEYLSDNWGNPLKVASITIDGIEECLESALATLTERERDIVKMFFGIGVQEMTPEEIGDKFGLTPENVKQIKENAIRRLRYPRNSKE